MTRAIATPTLLGVPWDRSSSYLRGAAAAPAAIRAALRCAAGNSFTESLRDLAMPGSSIAGTPVEGTWADAGDLELPEGGAGAGAEMGTKLGADLGAEMGGRIMPSAGTPARRAGTAPPAFRLIEDGVAAVLAGGGLPLVLGGDHAVSYPVVRAVARRHGPLAILHVDAHPDLYPDLDGDRWSHACPFARILEEGLATRLVQVGIRAMNSVQRAQAERFGVEVIDMRTWSAGVRPDLAGITYVSIDLDGLDPAFAPGVAHREPGGLTTRELLTLLQALPPGLCGADVVELNPACDLGAGGGAPAAGGELAAANAPLGLTALVAAKLVEELVDRMLERR